MGGTLKLVAWHGLRCTLLMRCFACKAMRWGGSAAPRHGQGVSMYVVKKKIVIINIIIVIIIIINVIFIIIIMLQ